MDQVNTTVQARRADVVIPVYADVALTRACIASVLECSGAALSRLILVDDCGPDPEMRPMLRAFREADPRVSVLENARNLGFVGTANRGLSICEGHAVVLNSDTRVTTGWLAELLRVLESSERIAAVCPLSNNGTLCSVPDFGESTQAEAVEGIVGTLETLPHWTELPTGNGFCMLMRDSARAALGLFDPAYGRGYNEENDWCQRARALGMVIARANHAFVFHRGEVSFSGARRMLDLVNAQRLVARFPEYLEENRSFAAGPEAHLAASAARARLGQVRVALHPGLPHVVGLESLAAVLAADGRFVPVAEQDRETVLDLLIAPLDHREHRQAHQVLAGTGRLVTVVDAWRPARYGWQRSTRHLQLLASDLVIAPSERVARWLAEEAPGVRVRVLEWPGAVRQARTGRCTKVVAWEPTPVVRALISEALVDAGAALQFAPLESRAGRSARHALLREAHAVVDLGGTPAGVHAEAASLGVPVIGGLLSVAGHTESDAMGPASARWLAGRLKALAPGPAVVRSEASGAVQAAWMDCLLEVVASPVGAAATLRASLQNR